MLNDHERKLLRILHNFQTGRKRNPSIEELVRKTGRWPWQIRKTLQSLTDQQFIIWDPDHHEQFIIVELGSSSIAKRIPRSGGNTISHILPITLFFV